MLSRRPLRLAIFWASQRNLIQFRKIRFIEIMAGVAEFEL